jgi:glycosyltransferase involved in cell wall biosynthesis
MAGGTKPLVCVLTPVYNGEKLLAGCIRSVLEQTYTNFQYIIVNNRSTDGTLEIAQSFAKLDSRIRIHDNVDFLNVVDNHNKAFSLIPEEAKYSKNVDADDWIFPNCLEELVKRAEEFPTVGMVTSYVMCGRGRVGWTGLRYPSNFMKGTDVCRLRLLNGVKVFGGPSASLLRARVVKEQMPFYKLDNYHGDTEAYLDLLQKYDFGFVHQVLSYNREGGDDSQTTGFLERVNSYPVADIEELVKFGPAYLTKEEHEMRLRETINKYYKMLAQAVLERRNKEFWDYHKSRLKVVGMKLDRFRLGRNILYRISDYILNPKQTLQGLWRRLFKKSRPANPTPRPAVRRETQAHETGS